MKTDFEVSNDDMICADQLSTKCPEFVEIDLVEPQQKDFSGLCGNTNVCTTSAMRS